MDEQQMQQAFVDYTTRLSAGDAYGVADLFADDAWIEDPIGGARIEGGAAILAFYTGAIERAHPTVELSGPVRTTKINTAAAPLRSRSFFNGAHAELDIIDVFTFNDDGKVTSMQAYWGPSNLRQLD